MTVLKRKNASVNKMTKEIEIPYQYIYIGIGSVVISGIILYLLRHQIYKKFDYKTEYLLLTLEPDTRKKVRRCIAANRKAGRDVRLIEADRPCERQDELYEQGRSKPGKIVTNAKCGQSAHNYRRAVDLVEFKDGKPLWDNPNWEAIGKACEAAGLQWGGRWTGLKDYPHFEDMAGKKVSDLYREFQKIRKLI